MQSEPTDIEQVAEQLWRVPLLTPTLPPAKRTNTYVWSAGPGLWIVDPGSPKRPEIAHLERFLDGPLAAHPVVGYVITHHHPDHWGGLRPLLDQRSAPVVTLEPARYRGLQAEFRSLEWFEDQLWDGVCVETPGHASDHLVVITEQRDVLAGDLVAGIGTVVINPPDGDMVAYLDSLRCLLERDVNRIFPAHGPTIEDGPGKLTEYIDHRLTRERQVVDALRALQPATPTKLVPRIYPDLSLMLRPVAARSVLAHLLKLEREGRAERVGRVGRKWGLRES